MEEGVLRLTSVLSDSALVQLAKVLPPRAFALFIH